MQPTFAKQLKHGSNQHYPYLSGTDKQHERTVNEGAQSANFSSVVPFQIIGSVKWCS